MLCKEDLSYVLVAIKREIDEELTLSKRPDWKEIRRLERELEIWESEQASAYPY